MEPSPYAGVGGKIRRRPTPRAAATPYDRPPAVAAAHRLAAAAAAAEPRQGGERGGWVSRLVDPASRLIAGGAARLFSTVFRKGIAPAPALAPPLSTPPGSNNEPNQDLPELTQTISTPILEKGKKPTGTSDDRALSEVEHLLMRKTFTRVEFDRLTDLLRARTVESDLSAPIDFHEVKNEARTRIDGTGGSTSHGMAADHSPAADDPVGFASSPAELAKQYMNSRYLREPQSSSLKSQVLLKNKAETSNISYYGSRSGRPVVEELNQSGNENSELPVNGYVTPGLRGRSAIYRMSRSPYFKGPSSSNDINIPPFSSSQARAHSLASGSRQVLKRRGSDFENELGSIGPIRRIRQKSNMMSTFRNTRLGSQGNFLPSRTIGSDLTDGSSSIQGSPSTKRLLLGTGQSLRPAEEHRSDEYGKSSRDNVLAASPQPNKMAEKIFEQLNIIVPSPKEKQSRPQSIAGNASRSMLKQPVWQDNEPKGASDATSSQKFQSLDRVNRFLDPEMNGSPSSNDQLRKDGSSKLSPPFQDLGNKDIDSDNVARTDKPAILRNSVTAMALGKPGFKMAVFEDLSEFDDDQKLPVPSKNLVDKTEVKTIDKKFDLKIKDQKVESNFVEKVVSAPVSENRKAIASPSKDVHSFGASSNVSEKRAAPDVPPDNNVGFKFPHVSPGTHPENNVSQVPLTSNDNKLISATASSFGLKQSGASDSGPSNTAGVKTEAILGESVTKPTTLDIINSERGNKRERAEDMDKLSDKVLPSTAPFHFTSTASTSPSLSNGFSHPSPPKLPNVTLTDKPAVSFAPSDNPAKFALSSSSPPISSPIPAIPTFSFGSSTSMATATKSDGTNTEAKPASSLSFSTGGATDDAKLKTQDMVNKASPNLSAAPISSNISSSPVTSSSTFSSTAPFSSSAIASSNDGTVSTTSASTAPFTFSSSGSSIFGFNSPAQLAGLSTSVGGSTAQPSATGTIFGSKLPQSDSTLSQTSKNSPVQFSSPFPTVTTATGASLSGSGTVSFGVGTASTGSGAVSFGIGTSSSGPSTMTFGSGASSSGTSALSFGAGASSSGTGTLSFGAGASSSGTGALSFGTGASSSGPGTAPFGVTTSSSGSLFGNSPFGSGTNFSGSGSGFAFSSPSSSAGSSLTMASTSMFSSSSMASSTPAFSNPFSSSSSPSSTFTFGQSASSGGGFSFGAQSSPAFSSQAPVFSFTSASTSMNSSSPQPAFRMANTTTAFGMGSPGNDQMNVEDSMADDTNQAAPAAPAPIFGSSPFGQPGSSSTGPVFGATPVQPSGVFQFGGQQGSMQQNTAFPPGGSLEFQGGNFSLGSGGGGGDKSNRRVIKVKRTTKKR